MQISKEQAEKLKRYFINADPFLWGVLEAKNKPEAKNKLEANKKGRLRKLKESGFLKDCPEGATYNRMNQDLLVELGIDGILERIVIGTVTETFAPDVLQYFRRCWDQGQNPDMKYLQKHKLYQKHRLTSAEVYESAGFQIDHRGFGKVARVVGHKDPAQLFVQIDRQHNFVERWTVFAGLWFEEIGLLVGS